MLLNFENYGTHEGKPENGIGATLVGSGNIWQDGDSATYATIQYGGFEDPWGHPYARIAELPLTKAEADKVTDVIITWTARVVQHDPDPDNSYRDQLSVTPLVRWGQGEEGYAGPSYYSLATAAWQGANADSLYADVNPNAPWEELYLPEDGSWKTFRERYSPSYAYGAVGGELTVQEILANDFTRVDAGGYKRNSPEFGGTQDHLRLYCMIYQEQFWSEDKFAVSEIQIELVGPVPSLVISGQEGGTRRRFVRPR